MLTISDYQINVVNFEAITRFKKNMEAIIELELNPKTEFDTSKLVNITYAFCIKNNIVLEKNIFMLVIAFACYGNEKMQEIIEKYSNLSSYDSETFVYLLFSNEKVPLEYGIERARDLINELPQLDI